MVAGGTGFRYEAVARDLYGVITYLHLAVTRRRRRAGELKESEYLTLALLHGHGTMIVGDIQRHLGVLPAQMSRIIRSLESRSTPLIDCQINSHDKRKIDVCLTEEGERTLRDYQMLRVRSLAELVGRLPDDDQEDLGRLLRQLHELAEQDATPRRGVSLADEASDDAVAIPN